MSITQDKINAIKTAIWGKLNTAEPMSGNDIPDKINDVYDAGKQEMLDSWWNSLTNNGARKTWNYAFSDMRLKNALFRPPCTMVANGNASCMFYNSLVDVPIDCQALEEELGYPILDTSGATNLSYFNYTGVFSTLGTVDISKVTNSSNLHYAFRTSSNINYLRSIKKLIVSTNTAFNSNMFQNATALTHCVFEGTIAKNGLDMSSCTQLDKESITSIINCTWNSDASTWGYTITLSQNAVATAFETEPGAYNGHLSEEWTALVQQAGNWTINLV